MVNPEKHRSVDDHETEATDRVDRTVDEGFDDSSAREAIGTENSANSGLTERLTDILVDEGDGDLLLQESDRGDTVLQFLQALDFQVMGACRADERLKPLLKLNVSSGAAEDRLLAHLSQHFEPSEVGMLARCLCIPLVTVRVGKINKQGTLLCPTATRGNLNLTLLPTSDLRISFIGDDGNTERLLTLSRDSQCSAVALEEMPADKSGLSFQIKTLDGKVFYFWCSEKSKLLGNELITKMKDLLKRKPSLAQLTGISESRLDCFATHLRAYLVGSSVNNRRPSSIVSLIPSSDTDSDFLELRQTAQSSPTSSKPLRSRPIGSQSGKSNSLYQGSLSPRSSSFKEGFPRILSSLRSVAREKLRRRDSPFSVVDHLSIASAVTTDASSLNHSGKDKLQEATEVCFLPPNLFESLGRSAAPPFLSPVSHVPLVGSSLFSPYYCLCPLIASSCQYTMTSPQLPISSTESFSLPPLSSLLQAANSLPPLSSLLQGAKSSSGLIPIPPLNVADIPPLDFPPMLPDPLVRLQLPRSSSQQIPTFTHLMCDPIVHIPVIDVCSSGQGYLVSAGSAISTTIPPLHSKLVNPLIPESASVVEQSARETLRMLINSSSHTNQQLMDVLPSVLSNTDDKQNVFSLGSRGLYSGGRDVGAIANSIAAMGLVSLSEKSVGGTAAKRCFSRDNLEDQFEIPGGGGLGGTCPNNDGGGSVTQLKEEWND